jgi:hypothetical protein
MLLKRCIDEVKEVGQDLVLFARCELFIEKMPSGDMRTKRFFFLLFSITSLVIWCEEY